ncbi:GNAT family N-acetyltransferase [Paenibacillus silvisoli]|uniref:GNAT family N-acetyltransferase n=1 Tax=Paenibacillus silvisoli TaxID=3110539 RepID=UPI002803ED9F|nr:GNAT family N-acetyltransferase [Paenibacillus silvisoli]
MRSEDGKALFAQTPGFNGWLWTSRDIPADRENGLLEELVSQLDGHPLPGISAAPRTAYHFARVYTRFNDLRYFTKMDMEAYVCPSLQRPRRVEGSARLAASEDVETIASFLAGFEQNAYGRTVTAEQLIEGAHGLVRKGGLYVWRVDDEIVSMANIAHRSPRHGRINAVYTTEVRRRKGFAGAIVAAAAEQLLAEGLTPMLYADLSNPASNQAYKNIGFMPSGQITEMTFSPH